MRAAGRRRFALCRHGSPPAPVLDFEPVLPGEDECSAAKRLVRRLKTVFGAAIGTILVDARYDEEPFRKVVRDAGYCIVVRHWAKSLPLPPPYAPVRLTPASPGLSKSFASCRDTPVMRMMHGFGIAALVAALAAGCGQVTPGLKPATAPATLAALDARKVRIATENFARLNDGLYRGGLPTEADLAALDRAGVRTVISLLGAGQASQRELVAQERRAAERAGLKFVNLVVPFSQPSRSLIDKFLATVKEPSNQPVYVHCMHGRDRTGAMIALYRITEDGYSGRQALAEMETFGYEPQRFPYYTKLVLNFDLAN